jgi:hypothetical protein
MKSKKKSSESSSASKGWLARVAKELPKVQPGTPAPLIWAASGALLGLGISMGAAAISDMVEHNLQFIALLLSALLKAFPVAVAGALIGAFLALGWFGYRR